MWIWIRTNLSSWIRIQEGKIEYKQKKKSMEIVNNCYFNKIKKKKLN